MTVRLPRGACEALLVAGIYLGGELTRGFADGGQALAERHAAAVVSAERSLHVFGEAAVQRAVGHLHGLPSLLGYAYLTLHLAVTAGVLAWAYRHRRHAYTRLRNTLVLANALAVVGYAVYPTAPPRLAGLGIADTVSGRTSLSLSSDLVSHMYNPYAAMPSMHVGFAVLVAVALWQLAERRAVRLAALAYPLFILLVIVATGNHFFLDAAAGAAVAAVAAIVGRATTRRRAGVMSGLPRPSAEALRLPRAA
jgi:PAP2 superfamily